VASEVVVVKTAMITPIGLSAPETEASARARTARLTEIEWRDRRFKPFVVGLVPDDGLPDLHPDFRSPPLPYREARMLRLAEVPILELLKTLPARVGAVPLLLGLPELQTTVPLVPPAFLERLVKQSEARIDLATSTWLEKGRASGLLAIAEAARLLEQGKAKFCIAGGVDSYVDLYILGTLDIQRRIRAEDNSDGFTPSEGAGFLLLTTAKFSFRTFEGR